ncbi:hypothetical protein VPH35_072548 [Triticum aestivum]
MVPASTVLTLLGFCASVLFIVFVCSRLVCSLTRRVRRGRRPSPPLPRFPPRRGQSRSLPPRSVRPPGTRRWRGRGRPSRRSRLSHPRLLRRRLPPRRGGGRLRHVCRLSCRVRR